jgi:GT2 family glycosyltransferase
MDRTDNHSATKFVKVFIIAMKSPIQFLKHLSRRNIKTLLKALRDESPAQIARSLQNLLIGNTLNPEEYKKYDKSEYLKQKQHTFQKFLQSGEKLIFPQNKPELSIILVFHNQAELSFSCLQSIIKYAAIHYEVIIVDNNSLDDTALLLNKIEGATIIRNNENLHFLKACNQALPHVRGKYLIFLNNDAEIIKDTISSAMQTITENSKCGAVGGKIILPDGKLQEAGSIIWNDGSCLGYGRGQSPNQPEYNFKRITDYCSGAFLLTKTELLERHGGFDKRFVPAYYEETDYCLWLQEQGLNVIYDPKAVIRHFEFGSGISDTAIALQQKNQKVFYEKHKIQLTKHYKPNINTVLKARFAASQHNKKRILYIDDRIPHNNLGSGFPRSNTIIRCMVELGYQITIYPLNFPVEDNWDRAYMDIDPFIEISMEYGREGVSNFLQSRSNYYDVIWISRPHNMEFVKDDLQLISKECKIIYDAEAIFAERNIVKIQLEGKGINSKKAEDALNKELSLCEVADTVTAVSVTDARKFSKYGAKHVHVLGHTLNINLINTPFEDRKGLLFVGNLDNDTSPNVDSVLWFVNEILPLVREKLPEVEVYIIGSALSQKINTLNIEGVHILGRVDDLTRYYAQCRVFIAPTRFASGIPYKIHEAASYGLPVVSTSLLAQQLNWEDQEMLIAADPDKKDYAEKLIMLYQQKSLWKSIKGNSLAYVKNEMSFKRYKQTISSLLNRVNLL